MRIGEVAEQTGVSVRALRYYEEQQLIAAQRTPSGQRRYSEKVIDRVRLIQLLYAAGLNSAAVAGIMPCMDSGTATPEIMDRLIAERARIEARIHDLNETRDRLDAVIAAARTSSSC